MDIIKNVTGSNIYIPDSNGDPIVNLAVEGNTTQASTPTPDAPQPVNVVSGGQEVNVVGKNLFNINDTYYRRSSNNSLTISGNNAIVENASTSSLGYIWWNIPVKTNKTITISYGDMIETEISNNNSVRYVFSSTPITTYTNDFGNSLITINKSNKYITTNSTDKYLIIALRIAYPNNDYTISDIQVEYGTKTTYEAYNGITKEINLGKNLFDISANNYTGNCTLDNGVYTSITLNTSTTRSVYFGYQANNNYTIYPNEIYYVSCDIRLVSGTATKGNVFKLNNSNITSAFVDNVNFTNEFQRYVSTNINNTNSPISVGRFIFQPSNTGLSDAVFEIKNVMISKSNNSTYAPYKTPIELCKINDYQDFIRKGTGKNLLDTSTAERGRYYGANEISVSGNWYIQQVPVKPNTTYYLSGNNYNNTNAYIVLLDTNKNYISVVGNYKNTHSITTTSATAYIGVSIADYQSTADMNTIMLEEGNQATLYEPYGYKDKWYLYKTIGKAILDGTETYGITTRTGYNYYLFSSNVSKFPNYARISGNTTICNIFNGVNNSAGTAVVFSQGNNVCCFRYNTSDTQNQFYITSSIDNVTDFKASLASKNAIVYYVLKAPTTTEITDTELISQLESVSLLYGINNVSVSSGDLPAILSIDYYTWYRYISPDDRQALIDNIATIPFKINVIQNNQVIKTLDEHSIISADYEDFRYVDTSTLVIGQFVARKFTGKLDNIYTDFEIEDTELNVQMGVSYNNNTNYYDLGNFLVTKPKKDNVKDKTSFESMDYTKKFNKVFDNTTLTYPCTALDLAKECCRQAGVELATLDFTNYNFQIPNNQYVENETCRKVMQDLGKLAYSWVRIDWDNRCYLDFNVKNNIVDSDKLTNSNYYSLNLQKKVFGPVNRVVIGMQDVEGENAVIEDAESIAQYGVTELQIYDNNITYTPELRLQAIQAATKLFGIAYTPVEMNTTGHPWLLGNEKVQITTMEDETIYTYPWDRSIAYNGHIKTKITSKADTKTETEYKNYGGLEDALRKTRIIVDKEQGEITALTTQTQTIRDDLRDNYYDQTQTNQLIQTASTGLTNTFSEAGGNNIFRNTGLWFSATTTEQTLLPSTSLYPSEELFMSAKIAYEFWDGIVKRVKEEKASNMNALLLQNGYVAQEQIVPNGKYTISFKYNKPIALSIAKVFINDVEYVLSEVNDTEFVEVIEVSSQHINIKFYCDIDNGCEIYDLMANAGEVKLAYSQNQNETTTDTVNISKGITITSSDTNTLFKADSDGIRIYDENSSSADPTTKFIDTGMETDEATIKNKANVVKTLWQEVGSQTWITRL